MFIYSYHVLRRTKEKKKYPMFSLLNGSFLTFWTHLGLGRDSLSNPLNDHNKIPADVQNFEVEISYEDKPFLLLTRYLCSLNYYTIVWK